MTSLSPAMYNVALLILLIVVVIWLFSSAYRVFSLHSLSASYARHELLHVEGITRYSNLTRDHLLSILRARSSHTAHLAQRYTVAAHIDAQHGCRVKREGGDDGGGEVGLHVRLSCTRVSRMDVFVGVPQVVVAQLQQQQHTKETPTTAAKGNIKSRFRVSPPTARTAQHTPPLPTRLVDNVLMHTVHLTIVCVVQFNKDKAAHAPSGGSKPNPVFNASPSMPPSRLALSPSPVANSPPSSHRSISTMRGPVSVSTLASLQVNEAGAWRNAAAGGVGGRGMVASASNSFLPVLEQNEEKKAEISGRDSEQSDKQAVDDSTRASPHFSTAPGGTPLRPVARTLSLAAHNEEDDEPLVKGWSVRDLTVLMRNKSATDDDVHALHDDEYMYRLPPILLPACSDKEVSVTVPREWLVRLHQRLESMSGEGESELYPIIIQLRPVDTDALPDKQSSGGASLEPLSHPLLADRAEEKEQATSWDDNTTKKGGAVWSEQSQQEDVLVAELTLLEVQGLRREGAMSPLSPRSPARVLRRLPSSRPSSPSASATPVPSAKSALSASASPASSFDEYLRHFQLCRQLIVPPTRGVYCLEELYGVDASSSAECLVCLTEAKDVLLLPCRHVSICHTCHKSVTRCPVCRSSIQSYMRWMDEEAVWKELGVAGSTDEAAALKEVWKSSPHPGLLPETPAGTDKGSEEDGAVELAAVASAAERSAEGEEQLGEDERKDAAGDATETGEPFPVLVSAERGSDVEMVAMGDGSIAAPNSPVYAHRRGVP